MPDLLTISISIFASGCLSAALVFLAKSWITERLRQSIQHEYAQKLEVHKATLKAEYDVALEKLRADNAQARAIEQTATGAYLDSRRVGHERTLNAIESIWTAILHTDKETPSIVGILDIILDEEYLKIFENEKLADTLATLSWEEISRRVHTKLEDQITIACTRRPVGSLSRRLFVPSGIVLVVVFHADLMLATILTA